MARKLTDTQKGYIAALKAAETEAEKDAAIFGLAADARLPAATIRNPLERGYITQGQADTIMGAEKPADVKPAPTGKNPRPAFTKRRLHIHKLLGGAG